MHRLNSINRNANHPNHPTEQTFHFCRNDFDRGTLWLNYSFSKQRFVKCNTFWRYNFFWSAIDSAFSDFCFYFSRCSSVCFFFMCFVDIFSFIAQINEGHSNHFLRWAVFPKYDMNSLLKQMILQRKTSFSAPQWKVRCSKAFDFIQKIFTPESFF